MKRSLRSTWLLLPLAGLCLGAVQSSHGERWTNTAGHAIEARLMALDAGVVSFHLPDGSTMNLPLASLASNEQTRVRQALGRVEIPPLVRADFEQCRRTLLRLEQLRSKKALSDEECGRRRAAALATLRKACAREALSAPRTDEVLHEAGRGPS
ncbi:MAG: hypothetical protein EOM20_18015 [Spartobacteria bacterium]|nr:hypothetical protein [Spartobacteria bacterium]